MSKITLVTGANRGLGRNTAISIAERCGDVIVAYRGNEEQAKEVVAEIQSLGRKSVALKLDLGNSANFPAFDDMLRSQLSEVWGRYTFDHLVNNAGHGEFAMLTETTEA